MRFVFLYMIVLMAVLASCKSTKMLIDEKKLFTALPALPESNINIPVKVYAKPFLKKAEGMAPKEFTSTGWPEYLQTSCDFRYKYRFVRSAFTFKCVNNKLQIIMNGSYQIAGSKTVCAFGKQASPWINGSCGFGNEPMRKVQVVIGSQLIFKPDYTLQTITKVDNILAIDKCTVTILNNDMTVEVADSIKASVNAFGIDMDKTVASFNMNALTQQLALQIGKKVPVKNYGYLKTNASAVKMGAVNLIGDTLYATLGINAYPEVSSDSINQTVTTFLPPLTTANLPAGFTINTNAVYDYTTLDTIINQTMRNKSFDISGQHIIIKYVDVLGLDKNKISLRVDFAGSKTGTIYLVGTPVLDVASQVLSIPDLDYSLNSNNVTLNVGDKLFNKKIIAMMREKATINVNELYLRNKPKFDASLNRVIKDGINTTGYTTGLKLSALVIKKDVVMLQAGLSGNLAVVVSKW